MSGATAGYALACRVVERPRRLACPHPARAPLKGARVSAAIEHEVLPGDVAGLGTADERAHLAELGRGAEPPGRVLGLTLPGDLLDRSPARLRDGRDGGAEPVGIEWARQDVVDRDVVSDGLPAEAGDEPGEPGAGAVRKAEDVDGRLYRDRRDVDDPAEAPRDHPVDDGLDQKDRREHVGVERAQPRIAIPLAKIARRRTPGVVHEDVRVGA